METTMPRPYTPRPNLNAIAVWRCEQVAKAEGRSLANAAERLIEEAWNRRQADKLRAALGGQLDKLGQHAQAHVGDASGV
jgi:hypothetical protein